MTIAKYLTALVGATAIAVVALSHPGRDSIGVAEEDFPVGYQPFPEGYGYLRDGATLQAAVDSGDRAVLREHGWKMFAGINQPAEGLDWPIWYTWPNTSAAFLDPDKPYAPCTRPEPDNARKAAARATQAGMRAKNVANVVKVDLSLPRYPIPAPVIEAYPGAVYQSESGCDLKDGRHFQFNGDIMIPTEALSKEAYEWIHPARPAAPSTQALYLRSTLDNLHASGVHGLQAPERHVVTKHMFWPVKRGGPGVLPVWNDDYGPAFTGYAGYEVWNELVAIDAAHPAPTGAAEVEYLYGVDFSDLPPERRPTLPITRKSAKVYDIDDFYHHQITQEDWDSFDEADKAILNASSYWAYDQPFGVGDYLVTVAMHVNTKEIPSWSLQSVWWSATPDEGMYAGNRPDLPHATGPWRHYKLVTSYGIEPAAGQDMPVEMNPYIELAIHPVASNCQNCHNRAGWPTGQQAGRASYQNPDCPDLLAYLTPKSACLANITLTDLQWIIPDRAY